jgi:hypothetical protein
MGVKFGADELVQWTMALRLHLRGGSSQVRQRDRMGLVGPGVLEDTGRKT